MSEPASESPRQRGVTTSAAQRPMRADARRNAERLLGSAHEAFGERGVQTSLEDVARRAGVGIGTLYRHFPTREALLEALLGQRMLDLGALADRLLATEPPARALAEWLRAVVQHSMTYHGVAASLMVGMLDETSELGVSCAVMRRAGAEVLAAARRAGVVRPDAEAVDLLVLANGIAWAAENSSCGQPRIDRLVSILLTGLLVA
ncbi:TetR/AcrR family transcriptional regulator [Kutzneria albida]|nr:TetR/AcrR family transcriptional regulator [Kutzneria albida]